MTENEAHQLAESADLPTHWKVNPVFSKLHKTWYVEAEKDNEKYVLYFTDGKKGRMVFE